MKVDLKKASVWLYPKPSLGLIYQEAVANAIDAGATKISILIKIESFEKPKSLSMVIEDNGCGFTDKNFHKFSELLCADSLDHKGMGRMVYLRYFQKIRVASVYENSKLRSFDFDLDFDGKSICEPLTSKKDNGSRLSFSGFLMKKVSSYYNLRPQDVKEYLLTVFFPRFRQMKLKNEKLEISIRLETLQEDRKNNFFSGEEVLTMQDLPDYKEVEIKASKLDLFSSISIYYRITKVGESRHPQDNEQKVSVSICSDNRAITYNKLLKKEQVPREYSAYIFIVSDLFKGSTNPSRQKLEFPSGYSEEDIVKTLKPRIRDILDKEIPSIRVQNAKIGKKIQKKFPHLSGCFNLEDSIGMALEEQLVEVAQNNFFAKQKEVLGYTGQLNDEKFNAALEYVSRSLTEYVLHRDIVIKALKQKDKTKSEKELHDILAPQHSIVRSESKEEAYFTTNLWLLDDKFMSFETMLSEATMETILKEIAEKDDEHGKDRPDIAIYFSQSPDGDDAPKSVETVIIELKKYGIHRYRAHDVISQLKDRARILCKHYPHKISRMWYYGIVEIDPEFEKDLKESDYYQVFSTGKVYAKSQKVVLEDENGNQVEKYVDVCIMNYETVLSDAEVRNNTLLNLLRKKMESFLKKDKE